MTTGTFFERLRMLEELIQAHPNSDSMDRLLLLIQDDAIANRLPALITPEWLEKLQVTGYFHNPPSAQLSVDGQTRSFPGWRPAMCLARLAETSPNTVYAAIENASGTDNDWVNGHLMDAALSLRIDLAAKWVEKEIPRIVSAEALYLWLPQSCRKMIVRLGSLENPILALKFANAVLGLNKVQDKRSSVSDALADSPQNTRDMAQMKVDRYQYSEAAKTVVEHLVPKLGVDALMMLSELLSTAIGLYRYSGDAPYDHSSVWRPSIQDDEGNILTDAHEALVTPVRDAAALLSKKSEIRQKVVLTLLDYKWHVFWRVALYAVQTSCKPNDQEYVALLANERLRENCRWLPEYFEMLEASFPTMGEKQKNGYLTWVETEPNLKEYEERYLQRHGKNPLRSDVEEYHAYSKIRLLRPIRDHLPKAWRTRYDAWLETSGSEPVHPPEQSVRTYSIGGPLQQEEVASKTVMGLLQYLRDWKPSVELRSSNYWAVDLARKVSADVKERPAQYLAVLNHFLDIGDPTWCEAIVDGFRDLENDDTTWNVLIPFCETLVSWGRERASPNAVGFPHSDFAHDMRSCRLSVLTLIKKGLEPAAKPSAIPQRFADDVWKILLRLLDDPDPKKQEPTPKGDRTDYSSASLNHVRPQALETSIAYAFWFLRNKYGTDDALNKRASSMRELPALSKILSTHLADSEHPAVWAVYGLHLTRLIVLGRDWVEENRASMFPSSPQLSLKRDTIWISFIKFYRQNLTANEILREQFNLAAERLDPTVQTSESSRHEADYRLAIHLMIMYWWEDVQIDTPPLSTFFNRANDDLRAHAIDYIGHQYADFVRKPRRADGVKDPTNSLKDLWERRNNDALAVAGKDREKEMAAFSSFFTSGGFEDGWALNRLEESLRWAKSQRSMYDEELAKKLSAMANSTHQAQAIRCLRMLVEGHQKEFGLPYWLQQTGDLIAGAAASGDEATVEECYKLINILGVQGIDSYRHLLPSKLGGTAKDK